MRHVCLPEDTFFYIFFLGIIGSLEERPCTYNSASLLATRLRWPWIRGSREHRYSGLWKGEMKDKQLENDLSEKIFMDMTAKDRRKKSALLSLYFAFSLAHQKPQERKETRYQK